MNAAPRVAAIHDLSCFGRCSLTVVLPTLSAMGVQCCPVPAAVLSTHTGGFDDIVRTDLTGQLAGTLKQWEGLKLSFDGVYTGYMASAEQIRLVAERLPGLKGTGSITVVDPVLGDQGKLYRAISAEMVQAMRELCHVADVILPNLTEAALLLDKDLGELPQGEELARQLSQGGRRSVVVTGVEQRAGQIGAAWYDRDSGQTGVEAAPKIDGAYHGSGDLFASVVTGALMRGAHLSKGVGQAASFVSNCIQRTLDVGAPRREGLEFEALLGQLSQRQW